MYNFNEAIDRRNTGSVKYEEMDIKFGRKDLIPFWIADMDIKSPGFILSSIMNRAEHGVFGYTKRMPEYYEAIIRWLDIRHHLKIARENIEYAPGVVFLLNIMIRKFTNKGDKVIIQPPVYYPFFQVVKGNHRGLVENNLILSQGRYFMDFEDLRRKAQDPACKMMILCSPHNPVGRVWTKEELETLGTICMENNVLVLCDEIHYDLVYPPHKHIPFASISPAFKKNSITCTGPSKTFNIAGLHSAFCIIHDEHKMKIYRKELGLLDLNRSNVFSREVTRIAYEEGEQWVDELMDFLEGNVHYVHHYMNTHIQGIKPLKMEGTYLMWLDCRDLGLSMEGIEDLFVNQAGLALDSGYWFGEAGKGFMRLNIACSKTMLTKGLEKLKQAIDRIG